jgi:hypothetical protein
MFAKEKQEFNSKFMKVEKVNDPAPKLLWDESKPSK